MGCSCLCAAFQSSALLKEVKARARAVALQQALRLQIDEKLTHNGMTVLHNVCSKPGLKGESQRKSMGIIFLAPNYQCV